MSEYTYQFYAAVCCGRFDADEYLAGLTEAVMKAVRGQGCANVKTEAFAQGSEGAYGRVIFEEGMNEPATAHAMNEARKDIAVTLTVKAEGLNGETEERIASGVLEYSEEHHLSPTPYTGRKCC